MGNMDVKRLAISKAACILMVMLLILNAQEVDSGNPDAKRLYDDLLSNYNKLVRPVANVTETVTVHLKLKLSQLIAVVSIFSPYNYIKGYINYQ